MGHPGHGGGRGTGAPRDLLVRQALVDEPCHLQTLPDSIELVRGAHVTQERRHRLGVAKPHEGVDQLVEIAIRALSPAINDTFTALTCIDWLTDCLCKIDPIWTPTQVHRDRNGFIRVISDQVSYERLVQRSFEKIRQAGRGMPAVMIRQLDALTTIMGQTTDPQRARVLMDQAEMIQRANAESVPEAADRADVERRFTELQALYGRFTGAAR